MNHAGAFGTRSAYRGFLFQRQAALLVTNNALCLMSGLERRFCLFIPARTFVWEGKRPVFIQLWLECSEAVKFWGA